MSFAPITVSNDSILGCFEEKEHGRSFEYVAATVFPEDKFRDYKHKIFCGPNAQETRFALVKKTVAYVVVDEDDNGGLIVEKWDIKRKWQRG